MIKRLYLFWQTQKNHLLVDLLLLFVLAATMFNLSNAVGQYRYLSFAAKAIERASKNDNDFYYTELQGYGISLEEENNNRERLNLILAIEAMPGVRAVYHCQSAQYQYGSGLYSVDICPDRQKDLYPELNRGQWFDKPVNDDGSVNAILYGTELWDREIGSFAELNQGGKQIRIRICGVIYPPVNIPAFRSVATNPNSMGFFSDSSCIIVGESEETRRLFTESQEFRDFPQCRNFLVSFEADAGESEIQAVRDILSQTGGLAPMQAIKKNTDEALSLQFKDIMVLPIFYVVISVAAFFSISLLYIFRQTYSYSVYYLAGFGKRRILLDVAAHTVGVILPAAVLNLIYVCRYPFWMMKGFVETTGYIPTYFDSFSAIVILLLSLAVLIVTMIASAGVLRSKSPAEFWSKSKE